MGYGPNTALGTNGTPAASRSAKTQQAALLERRRPEHRANGVGCCNLAELPRAQSRSSSARTCRHPDQLNTDKVNQVKLDGDLASRCTTVHFGAQFVDDLGLQGDTTPSPTTSGSSGRAMARPPNNYGRRRSAAIVLRRGPVGTWMPGYSGAAATSPHRASVAYNPWTVINYLLTQPVNADQNAIAVKDGYPAYAGGIPAMALNPNSVQQVDRNNYSPFITAEQDIPLGDMTLKADRGCGVRRPRSRSRASNAPLTKLAVGPGDRRHIRSTSGAETARRPANRTATSCRPWTSISWSSRTSR